MAVQEAFDDGQAVFVVEHLSAVAGVVDDLELDRGFDAFVGAKKFEGLVNRHLRVLVAVQKEQRRVGAIDMKNRAGKAGKRWSIGRERAEQELESGDTHGEPMRR